MASYLLAHDLGTSGNKATLFTTDGVLVESTVYSYGLNVSAGHRAEQNADDWWRAVCETTRQLIEKAGIAPSDIEAVSFSGHMMGCLCVDRDGVPVRDSLIWADLRSSAEEERIRQQISDEAYYYLTGQRLSASYSAPKLMWLKEHEPETYRKTYKTLNAKDYIILRLTGKFLTDPSDASGVGLMDIKKLQWSDELLEICGLDREKYPDIVPSVSVAGRVTSEAAAQCGLREGTPVVTGGGDGPCAAVGSGITKEGVANLSLGTSSWISFASRDPIVDDGMISFSLAHIVPGYYMPCGPMQCGGGSMSWAVRELYKDRTDDKNAVYADVNRCASVSPAGAKGLMFLPYLLGERSPRWNNHAKGAYIGLTFEHTREDMIRAVMEGVGYNLNMILEAFNKSEKRISELIVLGGGARNPAWLQILSDIFGLPLNVPNYLEEAASMGAAITAGVGIGAFADFSVIDKFLQNVSRFEPLANDGDRAVYLEMQARFDECYHALEPIFNKM